MYKSFKDILFTYFLYIFWSILYLYYFLRRCRNVKPGESPYYLNFESLQVSESDVEVLLLNRDYPNAKFNLTFTSLIDSTFRVLIDEVVSAHPRYKVSEAFDGKPQPEK